MLETIDRIPLTTAGRRQLEEEAERTAAQVAELRALAFEAHDDRAADDDERAAALALLDEQERAAARLKALRSVLERAIDAAPADADVAGVGTLVRGRDDDGGEWTYILVTPAEAAPTAGRISVESPVGRALLGRRAGDVVTVEAPQGAWQVEILGVAPAE